MSKVLLVDDEDRFRTSLARRLGARGYDVVDVDNGEDAVRRVRLDADIDIAVLDLKMPGMDGIQTLKEMRAFNPAIQAIMLTGHGSLDSAKDAGRLEAFKYLQKPCDVEELTAVLEEAKEQVVYAKARHEMAYQPVEGRSPCGGGSWETTTPGLCSSFWAPRSSPTVLMPLRPGSWSWWGPPKDSRQ